MCVQQSMDTNLEQSPLEGEGARRRRRKVWLEALHVVNCSSWIRQTHMKVTAFVLLKDRGKTCTICGGPQKICKWNLMATLAAAHHRWPASLTSNKSQAARFAFLGVLWMASSSLRWKGRGTQTEPVIVFLNSSGYQRRELFQRADETKRGRRLFNEPLTRREKAQNNTAISVTMATVISRLTRQSSISVWLWNLHLGTLMRSVGSFSHSERKAQREMTSSPSKRHVPPTTELHWLFYIIHPHWRPGGGWGLPILPRPCCVLLILPTVPSAIHCDYGASKQSLPTVI